MTGTSMLEAREGARDASDSDREAGRGRAARAVRSSNSSGLDRGDGVQISGSGLEEVPVLEPAPPRNRVTVVGGTTASDGNQNLPHLQQEVDTQQEKATCPHCIHARWRATAGVYICLQSQQTRPFEQVGQEATGWRHAASCFMRTVATKAAGVGGLFFFFFN